MSKSKTSLDMLGEAHLPADLLTPTMGSNYLLDGYPDMEYGLGVLEGEHPPGSSPSSEYKIEASAEEMSHEANDMFVDNAFGMDLRELNKEAGLADLDWLELNEQDLDRLPKNPVYLGISELEEAWGVNRRTDGIHVLPNVDLEGARYEASLKAPVETKKATQEELGRVVRKAMRQSASGEPLENILREAAQTLGYDAPRVRQAMHLIKAEHGLAGHVFIRASAYPGYEQGKWTKTIRRHAAQARYIVVDAKTLKGSTTVQNGWCTVTKKRAVTEVPWAEALATYQPKLIAAGHKLASGDPREALKRAFLGRPVKAEVDTYFPIHKSPSERVSLAEAKEAFANAPAPERQVFDDRTKHEARLRQAAYNRIQKWVQAGLLSKSAASTLLGQDTGGRDLLKMAAAHVMQTKGVSAFSGHPNDIRPPAVTMADARAFLATVKAPEAIDTTDRPLQARLHKATRKINQWVADQYISRTAADRILSSGAEPREMLRVAGLMVQKGRRKAAGNADAPTYNRSEFSLHNSNLETVALNEEPEAPLSDVSFGGMEF